jgi:hypothetical protein
MRLIAKAVLGALALASVVTASASAQSYSVQVGPNGVAVEPRDPCLRAPEFRPAFCFRHEWRPGYYDRFAYNRDRDMRERMLRERMREQERERQAYLDRHYWDMTH